MLVNTKISVLIFLNKILVNIHFQWRKTYFKVKVKVQSALFKSVLKCVKKLTLKCLSLSHLSGLLLHLYYII